MPRNVKVTSHGLTTHTEERWEEPNKEDWEEIAAAVKAESISSHLDQLEAVVQQIL